MRMATTQKLHNSLNRNLIHFGPKMYEDLSFLLPLSHFLNTETTEACLCLFSTELSSPQMNGTQSRELKIFKDDQPQRSLSFLLYGDTCFSG